MKQKIIRVGNSAAVTIPKSIFQSANLKIGTAVNMSYKPDAGALVVDFPKKAIKTASASHEFQKWLDMVLVEDKYLLEELAHR